MTALGVSAFLSEMDHSRATLEVAHQAGARTVFTSLHIPEDKPSELWDVARTLGAWARELGLGLIADVSPRIRASLGEAPWSALAEVGVSRVRLDDGYSPATMAEIADVLPIAVNASTVDPATLARALAAAPIDPVRDGVPSVIALHNYYPRRWTGLSLHVVADSVREWHEVGLTLGAFVSGDDVRRGPLREGLPTVEDLRDADPLVQILALESAGCDDILVGDPSMRAETWERVGAYLNGGAVEIPVVLASGLPANLAVALREEDVTRPDEAAHLVRFQGSRARMTGIELPTEGGQERPRGSVTIELDASGRYRGDLALTRTDLPADERVAVIGHMALSSDGLIDVIGPSRPVRLRPVEA